MIDTKLKLIGVEKETKIELDNRKEYPRETYDDVIRKLLKEDNI